MDTALLIVGNSFAIGALILAWLSVRYAEKAIALCKKQMEKSDGQ